MTAHALTAEQRARLLGASKAHPDESERDRLVRVAAEIVAEELATITRRPLGPGIHRGAVGIVREDDEALRALEAAVRHAIRLNNTASMVLGRVSNGLTGDVNGYRERLLTRALADAAEPILAMSQEDAKAILAQQRAAYDQAVEDGES